MKNRILSAVLASALVLTAAACGSGGDTRSEAGKDGKITLTGMTWGQTDTVEKMTEDFFKARPDLAGKYDIKWVVGGKGDADVAEKVRLAMSSNESVADFVQLNYIEVPELASAGALEDVSEQVNGFEDQLIDNAMKLTRYKDQTVAFPFEMKPRLWFYRKDVFDKAGVDPTKVKNVDDLIAAGKAIQKVDPNAYIWNIGAQESDYKYYLTLSGNGAKFRDDDGSFVLGSDPGVRAMVEDYKKLYDSGVVMKTPDWSTDWTNALSNGTIVSQLSASWLAQDAMLPTYAKGQEGDWAVTTWPQLGGADGGSDGGSVYVIPSFSSNAEAAKQFLAEWTMSVEGSKVVHDDTGAPAINVKAAKETADDSNSGFFGESFDTALDTALKQYSLFDYSTTALQETTIAVDAFNKAILGQENVDSALKQAQKDLEQTIMATE